MSRAAFVKLLNNYMLFKKTCQQFTAIYLTTVGSQVASSGNKQRMKISKNIAAPNGITPFTISVILLSGLMPWSTKRFIPTGGVISANSKFKSITTLNQMGSKPKLIISGNKMGRVMKIMETDSKMQPKKSNKQLIAINITQRLVSNSYK